MTDEERQELLERMVERDFKGTNREQFERFKTGYEAFLKFGPDATPIVTELFMQGLEPQEVLDKVDQLMSEKLHHASDVRNVTITEPQV